MKEGLSLFNHLLWFLCTDLHILSAVTSGSLANITLILHTALGYFSTRTDVHFAGHIDVFLWAD